MEIIEHGMLTQIIEVYNGCDWDFQNQRMKECKGDGLITVLNYLGKKGWEFAGQIESNKFILKKTIKR